MKVFLSSLITLVVAAGIYWAVTWYLGRQAAAAAEGTAVRVEPVALGDLVEIVSAPGLVQPKEKVSISARIAARIVDLPFDEGQAVTCGNPNANPPIPPSVLVKLDDKDLKAALRSTQARRDAQESQIKVAEAQIQAQRAQIVGSRVSLADAERDLRRQKELLASKDVSQAIVDQAQAKVDGYKAQLDSALENLRADEASLTVMQHNLEAAAADIVRAEDNLSYTTILSPIDGVVTRMNAKVGELVMTGTMNNAGTVILEVADLSKMLVVARVDETSMANLEVGQKATVRMQAYPDRVFEGTVDTVALAHTDDRDGTKYFKVEILLKTEGKRIYSGLSADVDIETKRHSGVLKVPSQAVLGRPVDTLPTGIRDLPEVDKRKTMCPVVYRLVDGKAVATPVKIGASDVIYTIIESGVREGDRIVTGPYKVLESLQHDQKVKEEQAATTQPTTKPTTRPQGQLAAAR
ncbi:MAG TPA: efflux RND transporter periplasmic adaptor subunit [Tepidisphaeraceae bacterium]|nr:efflux RND transporter periplasmic adaptor subunit [Tepidisphaeraceae bacterium]